MDDKPFEKLADLVCKLTLDVSNETPKVPEEVVYWVAQPHSPPSAPITRTTRVRIPKAIVRTNGISASGHSGQKIAVAIRLAKKRIPVAIGRISVKVALPLLGPAVVKHFARSRNRRVPLWPDSQCLLY